MSMPDGKVPVLCPTCDKRLLVPAGTIGKLGRCPSCKSVFTLEELFEAESVAAPSSFNADFDARNNAWSNPVTPSPYAESNFSDDYQLQAAPPKPISDFAAPQISPVPNALPNLQETYQPTAPKRTWDSSVLGGVVMMVIAVAWFVLVLLFDRIAFYPIILFFLGLVATIKGAVAGNLAGD